MTPAPLELELPADIDEAAVLALLGTRLDVEVGRAHAAERVLLDTFDARLRDAGLRAEWPARRTKRHELALHEPGMPVRRAMVADAPAVGVPDLPPGTLRDRLAPVLEERALLPVTRIRSRTLPVAVLNEDRKTVVRLALEFAAVGGAAMGPRLFAEPVRGYDRDFERVSVSLRGPLGLAVAEESLHDAAVRAAGGRPEGWPSKVRVDLEPGTRTDVAAGLVLVPLSEIAEANVPGVIEDLDTEFLHDLRVSIRRARSVLRELAGVHPPDVRARVRDELKWAQALTGPVRDLDVQLLEWDALTAATDGELEPLRRLLLRRRSRELTALRRGLRGARFAAAIEGWRALALTPPAEDSEDRPRAGLPIEAVASDRIRRVYRRMVRDGSAIRDASPDEDLHELRKRGKELRYLLEMFGSLFPADVVKPMVSALKDLQDVLGHFQDRSVQIDMLRETADELATVKDGPGAVLAAGSLISHLETDQRQTREGFAKRFDAFSSKAQRKLVRDTFEKLP